MKTLDTAKKTLRSQLIETRSSLSEQEVGNLSNDLNTNLESSWLWLSKEHRITKIFAYLPIKNEPNLLTFITNRQEKSNCKIYLPKTKGQEIEFFEWDLRRESLERGAFGVLEVCNASESALPDQNSMMLLPCLGADINGNRIGYGAGFYDRYLSKIDSDCLIKFAICFDTSVKEKINADSWDVPVDFIATNRRIICCTNKK